MIDILINLLNSTRFYYRIKYFNDSTASVVIYDPLSRIAEEFTFEASEVAESEITLVRINTQMCLAGLN